MGLSVPPGNNTPGISPPANRTPTFDVFSHDKVVNVSYMSGRAIFPAGLKDNRNIDTNLPEFAWLNSPRAGDVGNDLSCTSSVDALSCQYNSLFTSR